MDHVLQLMALTNSSLETELVPLSTPLKVNKFKSSTCYNPPHSRFYIYVCLLLVRFVHFVNFYITEYTSGLEHTIIKVMQVDTAQYGLLFSVYSWPNIIMCFVGGVFVDKVLGLRVGYVLFVLTSTLGQLVLSLGAFSGIYWIMLVGRFLVGIGNEMVKVLHKSFAAIWFKDNNLSFALSLQVGCGRLGGALALGVNHLLYQSFDFISIFRYRLSVTFGVGFGLLLISSIFSFIVFLLDKKRETLLEDNKKETKRINFKDIKNFSGSFWLVVGIIFLYFPVIFSFASIAQNFFMQKYGLSITEASIANAIVFAGVTICIPLLGILVDGIGFKVFWCVGGVSLALITHVTFITSSPQSFYLPYIIGLIGSLSYSILGASVWALPAYVIPKEQIATAYGITICFHNLGMSVLTVFIGFLIDNAGYMISELFYSLIVYIGLLLTIYLVMVDFSSNEQQRMNKSGSWIRQKQTESENEKLVN